MCDCADRCWKLLEWLGFVLEPEKGILILTTPRGRVLLDMDCKPNHSRVALLALFAKVVA